MIVWKNSLKSTHHYSCCEENCSGMKQGGRFWREVGKIFLKIIKFSQEICTNNNDHLKIYLSNLNWCNKGHSVFILSGSSFLRDSSFSIFFTLISYLDGITYLEEQRLQDKQKHLHEQLYLDEFWMNKIIFKNR